MMVNGSFFCLVCTFCIYIQTKLNLYLSEQILLSTSYFLLANKKKHTIACRFWIHNHRKHSSLCKHIKWLRKQSPLLKYKNNTVSLHCIERSPSQQQKQMIPIKNKRCTQQTLHFFIQNTHKWRQKQRMKTRETRKTQNNYFNAILFLICFLKLKIFCKTLITRHLKLVL